MGPYTDHGYITLPSQVWYNTQGAWDTARIYYEDGKWYLTMYMCCTGEAVDFGYDYIGLFSTTDLWNWTAENVVKRYRQATTIGTFLTKLTDSDYENFEMTGEIMLARGAPHMAGFEFRGSGGGAYQVVMDYNGAGFLRLYKDWVQISSVAFLTDDTGGYHQALIWRLKLQCAVDGEDRRIKVYYSTWGEEWREAFNTIDNDLPASGWVGLVTDDASAYFSNVRLKNMAYPEPVLSLN